MCPNKQGARALKGTAEDAAPYTLMRKFGDGIEIRQYLPQVCDDVT